MRKVLVDKESNRVRGRVGRRTVLKVGAAMAAGLALGTGYVRPEVLSVGVEETRAASPFYDPSDNDKGNGNGKGKGKDKDKKP